MNPQEFIAKWKPVNLSERSAAQQHFLDLCDLLGQPKPAAADPEGAWYTFERGVTKNTGGKGWADVWMRERFAWEYKGKHKDLAAAYQQLLRYREDLENPPLLVVCDMDRFEVHTNFTSTAKQVFAFDLDGLGEPANLDVLRKLFTQPEALKPKRTTAEVTREVADRFAQLADGMRGRSIPALEAAHFLMKLMFCMFAEDIELLPEKLFTKILAGSKNNPASLTKKLKALFQAMAGGGEFGADTIAHFNGGLFADAAVVELTPAEIEEVVRANDCDWSNVEPSIFGTLFERTLDPAKRSQIGAHYTSKEDILTLLEPVLMAPLRREWDEVRKRADELWERVKDAGKQGAAKKAKGFRQSFEKVLRDFGHRLEGVTVLDPACGSGNFLYVAINLLLDLEKQIISYASLHDMSWFPQVRPSQLAGIEVNEYAQELAQVVIWIGYLQWMHHNGFNPPNDPVLEPIENIRCMDAIINLSDPTNPKEPDWPTAEFIVGNPPFLGTKKLRGELGDVYVDNLFALYGSRIPNFSDLCCYWFEKARDHIEASKCKRAGLLATQGIRGGLNREVLKRIKDSGDLFFAQSDRDWILDGAHVHVSMVGFDGAEEARKLLNGQSVSAINPDLTVGANIAEARRLASCQGKSFVGVQKSGPYDVSLEQALSFLSEPALKDRVNSDVLRIYWTAIDLTRRPLDVWIILLEAEGIEEAASYVVPFEYLKNSVPAKRTAKHFSGYPFWKTWRPRGEMYAAFSGLTRYLATPHVSKHRVFAWADLCVCPSNLLITFAADDDFTFGVLQARAHEIWARAQGTQLREEESGFRYTPTTCFETFPFPTPTDAQQAAIAAAAKELDTLRTNWLNPPEWTKQEVLEFPGSVGGPWWRYVHDADSRGIGTVRYPRIVPRDAECAKKLAKRTLTNLYNERPTWLDLAHRKLDAAVFAAYGWDAGISDEELLAKLLALNLERAGK